MSYIVTNLTAYPLYLGSVSVPAGGSISLSALDIYASQAQASGLVSIVNTADGVPVSVSDSNNVSITRSVALTVGAAAVAAGRMIRINATTAGNVVVTLSGGTTETLAVVTGYQVFPYAVTGIVTAGTTAVATYANLY